MLEVYRGYGTRSEVFLIGRVFRQSRSDLATRGGIRSELRDVRRRLARRTIGEARVAARFYGAEETVTTDPDGYFRVHLRPAVEPPADATWHAVELRLVEPQPVEAQGQVFIPPPGSRFVVISDIDDTVMLTGVANKLGMLWRLFVADALPRVAGQSRATAACRSRSTPIRPYRAAR